MPKYDYEYSLIGAINRSPVEGAGKGSIDTDTGKFEAEIDFTRLPMLSAL